MTIRVKSSIKALFVAGAQPTADAFGDLVDSYADYDATLWAIVTAAQGGQTGLLEVESTAQVTVRSLGAGVLAFLGAATTAAARNALQLGALATAAGVNLNQFKPSTSGAIFGFNATGSAAAISGTSGNILVSKGSAVAAFETFASVASTAAVSALGAIKIATTADALAGTATDRVPSCTTFKGHEGAVKAWINFQGSAATIFDSYNILALTTPAAGQATITFTVPFASTAYSIAGNARANTDANVRVIGIFASLAGSQSAAGCKVGVSTAGGVAEDTTCALMFIGDQ